jgi:hypothetical protein
MSISPDNTGSAAFRAEKLAPPSCTLYIPLRPQHVLTTMDSLINTTASQHAMFLSRARKALACVTPRIDLFRFYSMLCKAVILAHDTLVENGGQKITSALSQHDLEDVLSDHFKQLTEGAENPDETNQNKAKE